jgi:hypothetical protein
MIAAGTTLMQALAEISTAVHSMLLLSAAHVAVAFKPHQNLQWLHVNTLQVVLSMQAAMTATGTMTDQDHAVPTTMVTSLPQYTAVDAVADKPSLFQFQRPYARTPKAKHVMEAMTLALGTLCIQTVADLTMT